MELSMTEAELFGSLAPVAVSLGCVAIALPDTILARSDQLSDHEFGVFNNSSPHCSFSVSPPFDFLRNWTILDTEAGWLLGLVEQIYIFPLSNCDLYDAYSHQVQVFASSSSSLFARTVGTSSLIALRCCSRAFRRRVIMVRALEAVIRLSLSYVSDVPKSFFIS